MLQSTVTSKGQTTIPGEIRAALQIKPGDRLEYRIEGDRVTFRVHPAHDAVQGGFGQRQGEEADLRTDPCRSCH